jgi:hypothetical protein
LSFSPRAEVATRLRPRRTGHNGIGYPVCLLLESVARLVDEHLGAAAVSSVFNPTGRLNTRNVRSLHR